MAKNKTGTTVAKFAPEASARKKTAVAKLNIPQVPLADLNKTIDDLKEKALAEYPDITRARASVTLY